MKRILSLGFLLFFFILLILCPRQTFQGAAAGLMLWFHTLLPSLLPFMILSNLIIKTDILKKWLHISGRFWQTFFRLSENGAYGLILGILCGYPMGTKVTADLYRENKISKNEAEYLLAFSSYPGISFLSTFLCIRILDDSRLILPTCSVIYVSGFFCSLLFRCKREPNARKKAASEYRPSAVPLNGALLDASIMNGFESITRLGGYVILFSIIQEILKSIACSDAIVFTMLRSMIEISTGMGILADTRLPFQLLYPVMTGLASHGGLCVAAQSKSMLGESDLRFRYYLEGKTCCSLFSFLLAYLFIKIAV